MIKPESFFVVCDLCDLSIGSSYLFVRQAVEDLPEWTFLEDFCFCARCSLKHKRILINLKALFSTLEQHKRMQRRAEDNLNAAMRIYLDIPSKQGVVNKFFNDHMRIDPMPGSGALFGFTPEEMEKTKELFLKTAPALGHMIDRSNKGLYDTEEGCKKMRESMQKESNRLQKKRDDAI